MRFALNDITMSENKMVVAKVTKRAVDKKLTAEDIARA
jgi:hypothetical protein